MPEGLGIVAAPGSEILIETLARLLPLGRAAVLGRTYGSHAAALSAAGHTVTISDQRFAVPDMRTAVVVNPDNPTGAIVDADRLLMLARLIGRTRGTLIVDEAFADMVPEASVIPRLAGEPVVVLRSFGKAYGLAGLRLGFAIGPEALTRAIARRLGDWAVSGPALAIGAAALDDPAWLDAARAEASAMAGRLDAVLRRHGFEIAGGTPLYRFVRHADATAIHAGLIERLILCRRFEHDPTALRFGLPSDDAGLDRLDSSLSATAAR